MSNRQQSRYPYGVLRAGLDRDIRNNDSRADAG